MYKVDSKTVIMAEGYVVVALNNLGYNLDTILKISSEVDRLFEDEGPEDIKRKAAKIMKPVLG